MARHKSIDSDAPTVREAALEPVGGEPTNGIESPPALSPKVKEHPATKFRRLRDRRMPLALKRLEALKNLASRQSYEYSGAEAAEIVAELQKAVEAITFAFSGNRIGATGWKSKVS